MKYLLIGIVGFVLLVLWLIAGVGRGMRKRDERVLKTLEPISRQLAEKKDVSPDEVRTMAMRAETRYFLYARLKEAGKTDLFPAEFLDERFQAESNLTYWMIHPNELQDPPEKMELMEVVDRTCGGKPGKFFIFKYKMPEKHWAGKDGWILGIAGPFFRDEKPYEIRRGAFSRINDHEGKITPTQLADWYFGMLQQKGQV
jgi:hypothetical protein